MQPSTSFPTPSSTHRSALLSEPYPAHGAELQPAAVAAAGKPDPAAAERCDELALRWELRRNCALTPRQLLVAYLVLCVPTIAIAVFAHRMGSPLVAVFSTIELLCVAAALLIYARHASDREVLTLQGQRLLVEVQCARQIERSEFDVAWLRVEDSGGPQKFCTIAQARRELSLGRHVAVARRQALARELRAAVVASRHRQAAPAA